MREVARAVLPTQFGVFQARAFEVIITRPGRDHLVSQDTSIDDLEAEASRRLAAALDPCAIDALLADARISGTPLDGVDGLLNQMTKAVIERTFGRRDDSRVGLSAG